MQPAEPMHGSSLLLLKAARPPTPSDGRRLRPTWDAVGAEDARGGAHEGWGEVGWDAGRTSRGFLLDKRREKWDLVNLDEILQDFDGLVG